MKIVQALHYDYKVALDQIAVLTPYSAQREEIKKEMITNKQRPLTKPGTPQEVAVKVASITESQGLCTNIYVV